MCNCSGYMTKYDKEIEFALTMAYYPSYLIYFLLSKPLFVIKFKTFKYEKVYKTVCFENFD